MANAFYNPFKTDMLGNLQAFDIDTDSIKAALIDGADYTFASTHTDLSGGARDVPLAAIEAESAALTTPVISAVANFDTDDFTWSAVSGDPCENIILYDSTLVNEQLMIFYDTGMTGMPVTPNGGDINVTVNVSGWFTL